MAPDSFFNEALSKKLPLLIACFFLFILTLYTFSASGITLSTLLDFGETFGDFSKLISLSSVLFTIAFTIALSLNAYFGMNLSKKQAAVPLTVYVLIALASFAVLPVHFFIFLAIAITFGAAALMAARVSTAPGEALTSTTRRALTVFLLVLVLFTIVQVELNKSKYVDDFLTGATSLAPQISGQILPVCADFISRQTPQTLTSSVNAVSQTQFNYEFYRQVIQNNSNCIAPMYSELSQSERGNAEQLERQNQVGIASDTRDRIASAIQSPDQLTQIQQSPTQLANFKTQLRQSPMFKGIETLFSIFVAFILFSIISLFNFVVKLIGYPINYALTKISALSLFKEEETKE